jgi:hypothetical protein
MLKMDSNSVLQAAIKNRIPGEMARTYQGMIDRLKEKGI